MPITGSGEGLLTVCGGTGGLLPYSFLPAIFLASTSSKYAFALSFVLVGRRPPDQSLGSEFWRWRAMVYAALVLRGSSGSPLKLRQPQGPPWNCLQPAAWSSLLWIVKTACRGHSGGWSAAAAHVTLGL